MTLREMLVIAEAHVLSDHPPLDMPVRSVYAADLMSDVLAFAAPGSILITGLCNPQVVRTSDLAGVVGIVLVHGKNPPPETIALAREMGITLMTSKCSMFELCGRLYCAGLKTTP